MSTDLLTRIINLPALWRRALAFGFLLLAAGLVLVPASLALGSLSARRVEIADQRLLLGRLYQTIATAEAVAATAPADISGSMDEELWHGETASLVRGRIQGRINAIAGATGASVLAAANAPDRTEKDVTYFGMRLSVSGSNENLLNFLSEVEHSVPMLLFREATLRTATGTVTAAGQPPSDLFAEIVVYGAVKVPAKGQTP